MSIPIFPLEQAQQLPGPLLWHASKLWQQSLQTALKPLGLSSTNAVILSNLLHLSLEKKPASQAELARLSGVDLMTTSTALRTLEQKGFVARTANKQDKRANILGLTPLGERTAYAALETIAYTHERFFGAISKDSLNNLREGLHDIVAAHRRP